MLSESDIKRMANLSRINITPEEEREFSRSIFSVLDYVSRLKEVDSGLKGGFSDLAGLPADLAGNSANFRDDDLDADLPELAYNLTDAAPETKNGYIKVKRIL